MQDRSNYRVSVPTSAGNTGKQFNAPDSDAYYAPSRNGGYHDQNAGQRLDHGGFGNKENRVTPVSDPDEYGDEDLFSTVMGTPPMPILADEAGDEYGYGYGDHHYTEGRAAEVISDDGSVMEMEQPAEIIKPKKPSSARKEAGPAESLMRHPWSPDVKKVLAKVFKLRGFRPNQLEAINATLAGKDVFVLMPTGGGKSLCYQLPSVISSGKTHGVTVVVSPLLSLMEDQVQHLKKLNVQAFLINSTTSSEEKQQLRNAFREPNVEQFVQVLYVTPEMLSKNESMVNSLVRLSDRGKLARPLLKIDAYPNLGSAVTWKEVTLNGYSTGF
ncbi:ATP-dependent DNA helicase sgs1 [Zalaria obscura]|uniref:ATP-dependent DNA helicase sgs1 n=1 Tax=Zalaria obscura TaxID=2024903 RepID=A0ACC3S7P4_9PEZI